MTMRIGFIGVFILLVLGGAILLRGSNRQGSGGWLKMIFAILITAAIVFVVWLAIMVIAVGPSLR